MNEMNLLDILAGILFVLPMVALVMPGKYKIRRVAFVVVSLVVILAGVLMGIFTGNFKYLGVGALAATFLVSFGLWKLVDRMV